jgi:MerR family copper efflux transcriptional regulator
MTIDGMHQIGEVAEAVGLSLRTIRHWDEVALVPPSGRSAGGFRLYTDADIDRLRMVKSLKPLDLTLEEIRDLLETRDRLHARPTNAARARLQEHLVMYATLAERRCDGLREELSSIEALARTLRSESSSHREARQAPVTPSGRDPSPGTQSPSGA